MTDGLLERGKDEKARNTRREGFRAVDKKVKRMEYRLKTYHLNISLGKRP